MTQFKNSSRTNTSINNSSKFDFLAFCSEYLELREETRAEINIKLAAYSIAFALAVLGNILVIVIVLRKSQFKTTTNLFIINMAFSDVLMSVVCMPSTIYSIATQNMGESILIGWYGVLLCKLLPFLQALSIAVSILTLATLAGDRYCAIVYPFLNLISKNRARVLIAVIWFVSACFNAPFLYFMNLNEGICRENWEPYLDDDNSAKIYTIVTFVFLYAVPLVLITFFYAALVKELWHGSRLHSNQTRAFSENKSVLKMVMTIVIIFAICWLPLHAITFVVLFTEDLHLRICGVKQSILFMGWFMGHVTTAINPVIYLVFNESFRREVFKIFQGMCRRCVRKSHVVSERQYPGSRSSATRQTQAASSSSNEDKSTAGKANDAFEMISEAGATNNA